MAAGVQFFYAAQDDTAIEAVRFAAASLPPETDLAVTLAGTRRRHVPAAQGHDVRPVAFVTVLADTARRARRPSTPRTPP